jgi:TatD DNase family protein
MLCPKDVQLEYFAKQLEIAAELDLPLFLHSRAAHNDFLRILKEKAPEGGWKHRGVVHSFTGTIEEMKELVEEGWDIGVNGCSLKTAENCDVVKEIPLERLQVETDGPWCEIRASHAGMGFLKAGEGLEGEEWKWCKKEKFTEGSLIKGRNEPCLIGRVVKAVAAIKGLSVEVVSEAAWGNTVRMFGLEE